MALRRVLAVSLLALASPALAQPAGAPIATAPGAAQAAAPAAASPAAPSQASAKDPWPAGAPRDEYEFTAWCYGALKQHMELYPTVKPALQAISKRWKTEEQDEKSYNDQLAAGREILADLTRALTETEKASPKAINVQGAAAVEQGRRVWAQFGSVEPNLQAYSWMNWELPERCVSIPKALEAKSKLLGQALKANTTTPPKPMPSATPSPAAVEAPKAALAPSKIETPKIEAPKVLAPAGDRLATTAADKPVAAAAEKPADKPADKAKEKPPAKPARPKMSYRNPLPP